MRILLMLAMAATCLQANANLSDRVDDCYDSEGNVRNASYCSDREIIKTIRRLRRRIVELEGGQGGGSEHEHSVVYSCLGADPTLSKYVIKQDGEVARTDHLQTFTAGSDEQEQKDCRNAMKAQEMYIASEQTSQCSCRGADPVLTLEIINGNFQTVRKVNVAKFKAGSDEQEQRDCRNFMAELPVCN